MKTIITNSFGILDESRLDRLDQWVNKAINRAFNEGRFFELNLDPDLSMRLGENSDDDAFKSEINGITERVFEKAAGDDLNIKTRLDSDVRLTDRMEHAIRFLHRMGSDDPESGLFRRRIVIIKEEKGSPTIFHEPPHSTVLAHVGSGAEWEENPTIYVGLRMLDIIRIEEREGDNKFFEIFKNLLNYNERAIETGYVHAANLPADLQDGVSEYVNRLVEYVVQGRFDSIEIPRPEKIGKFTLKDRERYLAMLDARLSEDILNFDWELNIQAEESLEELANHYKTTSDEDSLREVVRLLVAASGHDIHEVRNRANIALERALAPKEWGAPLAVRFINAKVDELVELDFVCDLPDGEELFLRVFESEFTGEFFLNKDIKYRDYPLTFDEKRNAHLVTVSHGIVGQLDFVLMRRRGKSEEYVGDHWTSGRINILPDIRGEVILEIFTDIHGHTRTWWRTNSKNPGLVYNEMGQVIRLGRFSDVTAHLKDIKDRYLIAAIYLLGVQKRGSNSNDWADGATSPSPFSPMSLTLIEPSLGGEEEFRQMVKTAHDLDIRVIVDVVPHVNRTSQEIPEDFGVLCYDDGGNLVIRASTDGRYGSWNDGKLLNYRRFEVWEWMADSIETLLDKYDLDGIRFDSAHAVPIMMKRNNFPFVYDRRRTAEEMVEGHIIVNEMEHSHMVTTGYYDAACRDDIAVPLHYFLMLRVQQVLRRKGKNYFINLAECYWGHERFLARSGVFPYNSAMFKISENITHGKSDVREIYHVYDHYFPYALPRGTVMLGILGNHDERRALNTFGHRGVRAAVALTVFMSEIVMDYEGSAEGEGWKVYLDNIYVNWNQFEYAAHRSLEGFYRDWYQFHRRVKGKGHMVWANNHMVAAAMKFTEEGAWLGAFNFSDENQFISIQFDNPRLEIPDDGFYMVEDPLYSPITTHYNYYTGKELKVSRISTQVSYTERVKLLVLSRVRDPDRQYYKFLQDSFYRLCTLSDNSSFMSSFAFNEILTRINTFEDFSLFIKNHLIKIFWDNNRDLLELGLKRTIYHIFEQGLKSGSILMEYLEGMTKHSDEKLQSLGQSLMNYNKRGAWVFLSAEAEPFSRSGGLGNVVFELPRELKKMGEEVYVITGLYRHGDDKGAQKMERALKKYRVEYTGINVKFRILEWEYEVGVHTCVVDHVRYYLLDHYEFFDGLYWGFTSSEKVRKRIAFARASAEVICTFGLKPHFTISNDAFTGLFNGLVRSDYNYYSNPNFQRTTYFHMIHNGGWQYFDAFDRYENGFDLMSMLNIPGWKAGDFMDPVHGDRINCMASGVRFADRVITVSPSYARQIEYQCDGMEHILHNVLGISNAIGSDFFENIVKRYAESGFATRQYPKLIELFHRDEELRHKVEKRYPQILNNIDIVKDIQDFTKRNTYVRALNKMMLQMERGLKVDPDIPMAVMIHRITEQKGHQLLLESSHGIFNHLKFQVIIGGAVSSGDRKGEEIAHGLWLLSQHFPEYVSVNFGFQDIAIPLLSSDLFLMPSMSEPGGISQLEAFAAGNLVVARATGGLRDTVLPLTQDENKLEGNGFLFNDYSSRAFYDAMERAHAFLQNDDDVILEARRNAENSAIFWDRPARQYIKHLYGVKEIIRIMDDETSRE